MSKYVTMEFKPNFKEVGKLFGSNINKFSEYLKNITDEDVKVFESGNLHLEFDGIDYLIESNYVIKTIKSQEGYNAVMLNYKVVVINTVLDQNLINEGIAREIVSKIQNLRKTSGFDIADRIDVKFNGPKDILSAIKQYKQYIMNEVLAVNFEESELANEELKINDYLMNISISKK